MLPELPELEDAFRAELMALLGTFESKLLTLEEHADGAHLDEVFRCAHNIKSAAAMLGLDAVVARAHALESILEQLRSGTRAINADAITEMLCELDQLRTDLSGTAQARAKSPSGSAAAPVRLVRIGLRLDPGALQRGLDPLALLRAVAEYGPLVDGDTDDSELPDLEALDVERLYLRFSVVVKTAASEQDLRSIFLFAAHDSEIEIRTLGPAAEESTAAESAAREPPEAAESGLKTLMVSVSRAEALAELTAELSLATSRLEQLRDESSAVDSGRLRTACGEIRYLVSRLQEATMSIRLVPVGPTFGLLRRYVRDQASRLGKEVDLVLRGAQTEVDKTIAERLFDPLKHLVRNAIDHGIEPAEQRLSLGKPERGVLTLEARQEHGRVLLSVHDDGRGLDRELIRRTAIERGLLAADAEFTDADAYGMIFRPGFTTSANVGELSGRGVGLDVVQKNIRQMGGDLRVGSQLGAGTLFILSLPLTLAMIEGVILRCGAHRLVVPLDVTYMIVRPQREHLVRLPSGAELLSLPDGQALLVRLGSVLGLTASTPDIPPLGVVVKAPHGRLVLCVDEIVSHEAVLLRGFHRSLRIGAGILAAAVMAEGGVALVLDIAALAELVAPPAAPLTSLGAADHLIRPNWS